MSWMEPLWTDILNRALSDTGTGGLFDTGGALITGFYNTKAPANLAFPFVTFNVTDATNESGFTTRVFVANVDFHVWTEVHAGPGSPSASYAGMALAHDIIDRLMGDWESQSGGVPTFGFDRWQPTPSPYGASVMEHKNTAESHTDDLYHYVLSFGVRLSRVGA